jgi:hypothetical protein
MIKERIKVNRLGNYYNSVIIVLVPLKHTNYESQAFRSIVAFFLKVFLQDFINP